uniref:NACHT domain-containing protein n=1 Tax=Gasterosteus aculeatus aculeatus TaxID=481459 RepID=A0AAQ4S4E9_GASAC
MEQAETTSTDTGLWPERPVSPASSTISGISVRSKDYPPNFSKGECGIFPKAERPASPAFSNIYSISVCSKDDPPCFSKGEWGGLWPERPVSPASSTISGLSVRSKDYPPNFSKGEQGGLWPERPVSPASSTFSSLRGRAMDKPINIIEGEHGLSELEQAPTVDDALNSFPVNSPSMETGQERKDIRTDKDALQRKILHQYEEELRGLETETELFEIQDAKNTKATALKSFDHLFTSSKWLVWSSKVRTVLTKGVAGVGKTFQTKLFMVDWAKQKSNKKINLIVSFNFDWLNSRKKDQSLKDLIRQSLSEDEHRVYNYKECKIAFVLDGLEKCELPLDFQKNKKLTDMEEEASMDVLLTNLIKGNLLPSAKLWILSQPSGVNKIPPDYIKKVTECRETKRWQKLTSALRARILRENPQEEDINHPDKKNIEHVMRNDRSGEVDSEENNVTRVNAGSDIFKETKGKKIKTVQTTKEAGIEKSFYVQKFLREWAKNDKSPLGDHILIQLNLLTLNFKEKVSLMGLVNRFINETKRSVVSTSDQFPVLFVLRGLDAYQRPLDFDINDTVTDVREPASVDVILTNLIRGTLLPSARIWITCPLKLPDACVDRMTQIRWKPDIASRKMLKSQLKEQFSHVPEGTDMQKPSALLNEIYTDLYIIEGQRGEVNAQHEIRQVQDAKFKPDGEEIMIKYHDIFKQSPGLNIPIRTVLTVGVAGIGKTFGTKKYMLDWAEDKANGDMFYMFPLSFRELNLRKEQKLSLEELLHQFFPSMKTSEIKDYDQYRILVVLDGLDECRLDLDFNKSTDWTEMRKPTSVNVLLTNLIQGNLLSNAQIWITSRPAASNHIPADKVDRVTEVRGFNNEQKEEYFRKRFSDEELAEKILSHVKQCRSLYIMCHVPVFCYITAKVLEDFVIRKKEGRMPKTMTDMYIYFIMLQCRQANVKYGEDVTVETSDTNSCWNTTNKETIMSLGKLAFDGLQEGNLLYTEENLTDCGVDIEKTAVFSGLFTQVTREASGLYPQKLFCFVHLSVQEFLAAFHVFLIFQNTGENLLAGGGDSPADFYKTAVNKALESKTGEWDLFLRFLLGLSLETNQNLLEELLKKTEHNDNIMKETIGYIKEKIREENSDADKNLNLFHCLNELNDHSLVEEVKTYLQSETVTFEEFSTSQWSALTFVLLTSDEKFDVFDLKRYLKSEKVLLGMLPVVKVSKTALLSWCELSQESCRGLASSVIGAPSSNLTELDLSHNDLLDSGVQMLAGGLQSPHCRLEILKLLGCQVTEKGCSFLASALKSNTASTLKLLDLSYNHPGVNGKAELNAIVEDPNMSLKTLCLDHDGAHRLKPGLKKYGDDLKLDEIAASKRLVLSDGGRKAKTVQLVKEKVQRPECADRFKRTQVFCEKGLNGLCYWEVECKGEVGIAVAYRTVGRRWDRSGGLGCNDKSWSLLCSKTRYTAIHGKTSKDVKPNNGKTSKDIEPNIKKTSKGVKSNIKKTSKGVESNIKKTSKGVEPNIKKTSKGVEPNIKKTSKGVEPNDQKYKDVEILSPNNGKTSNDIEHKDKMTSQDVEPNDHKKYKAVEPNNGKTFEDVDHNGERTPEAGNPKENIHHTKKIGIFLDWEAGSLTYYCVRSEKKELIHTFHGKFTEPVFPCFWFKKGSVTLCNDP